MAIASRSDAPLGVSEGDHDVGLPEVSSSVQEVAPRGSASGVRGSGKMGIVGSAGL
jgi:hypothetical protein